ncbi:MAG: hypothetical protein IVW55_11850 [Chloroflexi bacterium]|nr:hypothetical protein [Chloroflexota bacterium]
MARINGVDEDAEGITGYTAQLFEAQRKKYGKVLNTNLVYARRPTILQAVRGMWSGLARSETLTGRLVYLVDVRVAGLVGCPF